MDEPPRCVHPSRVLSTPDRRLLLGALACGAVFAFGLPRLWPLVDVPLGVPSEQLEQQAREALIAEGFPVADWSAASRFTLAKHTLDFVDAAEGREALQGRLRAGSRLARYQVRLKQRGEADHWVVELGGAGQRLAFTHELPEDSPGASLEPEAARVLAVAAARRLLGVELGGDVWLETKASSTDRSARRDHEFRWERRSPTSTLSEAVVVELAGEDLRSARLILTEPASFQRSGRADSSSARAVEAVGYLLAFGCALAGFFVFLQQLGEGRVRLRRTAGLAAFIFCGMLAVWLMEEERLFRSWDPLVPRWLNTVEFVVDRLTRDGWQMLLLLAVIGAADALDRQSGAERGASLWRFLSGRWTHPSVGAASARGFGVGLICGGLLTVLVLALQAAAGAESALQPRGVFFVTLNSATPALASVLFFLNAALIEELGYRFFGGTWLLSVTRRRWLAIAIPALVFGLTHARMDFLPPAEPFWARPLVMTCVGLVWGWALFRFDALTVVLSHWVADLIFFGWPRMASGELWVVLPAVLACFVPLIPALLALGRFGSRREPERGPPARAG